MWYKVAQNGFGGGMFNAFEFQAQKALTQPNKSKTSAQDNVDNQQINNNPIDEPTDLYQKRIWDAIVNKENGIVPQETLDVDGYPVLNGQAVESSEARRLSPYHPNPEETTMEEQLEALRHENVNNDDAQSMSSTEGARGEQLVRGEYPYMSGKGWNGYEDLPSNKSWA